MNLPNVLTLSRIFLALLLVLFLKEGSLSGYVWAGLVFAIASLTDFYDGHLAKCRGLVSDFGKIMDPVADKILLLSAFGALAHIGMVAWWMFIVIALREVLVTAWRLWAMREGRVMAAERAGKIKTVVQIIAVCVILLYLIVSRCPHCSVWFNPMKDLWLSVNSFLVFAAMALTVYSGIEYFRHS